MKLWQVSLLSLMFTSQVMASVKAYFNHNQSNSYTEPYRKITRPGDNLEQVILDQIAKAKKTIFVAVQEFRLPLVAQALIDKKNAGVDVRVIIEHDYNFTVMSQHDVEGEHEATRSADLIAFVDENADGKISKHELETRDAIYMLRAAKIPMMDDTADGSSGSALMHHKFMVVDGNSTIISTANFTLSCIHGDILAPSSRGNANSMITVASVALAKIFKNEFLEMWGDGKHGKFGQNKTYRPPQSITIRGVKITAQFSPTSARMDWNTSVNGLIAQTLAKAESSIKGALFVFSDQNLSNVMEQRHSAGVDIGFLIESKFAYRDYSELLDMMGLQMPTADCSYEPGNNPWRKAAAELGTSILPKGDILHHKFAVVDEKTVIMGSQNWSDSANFSNDETLIVVEDAKISDLYGQEYNRLKEKSRLGAPTTVLSEISRLEAQCAE